MHAHVITCVHLRQTIHSRSQVIHMYFDFTGQLPDLNDSCYDKVALLIGNKHYERDILKLNTPENDTQDMAGILLSAGFKVVSLVNLNKIEMEMVRAGKMAVGYCWRGCSTGGVSGSLCELVVVHETVGVVSCCVMVNMHGGLCFGDKILLLV